MKKFVAASLFITAFLLLGCEPAATFDKPQPADVKSLTSFPRRLQGKYISANQASVITITDQLITRQYDFDVKEHKDNIGSSYKLVGDTVVDQTDGTKEKVVVTDDSIIFHANWTDTLFSVTTRNVIKKFKGYYFLNKYYGDNAWEVNKLSLQNGVLSVGSISDIDDIQKLKAITETTNDTMAKHFALSRRQFKKFVRRDGFSEEETFARVEEDGM
ncbi:hypothetical protein OCK74_07755 [Chitinophagaceae bacterium LB-8]|uniref:Lipoprotein n=1 Tax=Paraflavisolibacter caeni TaxID=2982496 RepID=A0A9X3B7X7_9BACT|nr:hypothetical protein [Paraflavisolibacter caeni]MCU7549006.1 hypothetical protein [Paraflavisolibacter caeni]